MPVAATKSIATIAEQIGRDGFWMGVFAETSGRSGSFMSDGGLRFTFLKSCSRGYDPEKVVTELSRGKEKYQNFEHFSADAVGKRVMRRCSHT
jgi:hypothetical protein